MVLQLCELLESCPCSRLGIQTALHLRRQTEPHEKLPMAMSEILAQAEMQKSKVAICNPTFNQATKVS